MNESQSTLLYTAPVICLQQNSSLIQRTPERHQYYEMFLLLTGEVHLYLEQYGVRMQKGSGLFIPPELLHRSHCPRQNSCSSLSILIEPGYFRSLSTLQTNLAQILKQSAPLPFFSFQLPEESFSEFSSKCHILHNTLTNPQYGSDILAECLIKELLLFLNTLPPHLTNRKKDLLQVPSILSKLIPYILNHLTSDLSADTLSGLFHHSEAYINSQLLRTIGVTLSDYILLKRLHLACQYLTEGYPPAQACCASGFHNYVSFCKAFIRHMGSTPSQYQLRTVKKGFQE